MKPSIRPAAIVLAALLAGLSPAGAAGAAVMQGAFSIIGLERATGSVGVAVVSVEPACGAQVPWVQAGVGAVATQGDVNPGWGVRGLGMLREGVPPQVVCDSLFRSDPQFMRRQIGVLDRRGIPGGFTGLELIGFSGGVIDSFCAVQGSGLSSATALMAARDSFVERRDLALPDRLLHVLAQGAAHAGPIRSAALLVGRVDPDRAESASRWIYLRADDCADPLAELARLYRDWSAARLVESHLHFAELYEKSGSPALASRERAQADARIASALADTSLAARTLNALAWGLAQHGARLDAARLAAERAIAREPGNAAYLDTAAEVAARRGDLAGALALARRASEAAPDDEYLRERVKALDGGAASGR